jgi:hypothetical protein
VGERVRVVGEHRQLLNLVKRRHQHLCRAKPRAGRDLRFRIGSDCPLVFVDDAAEDTSSPYGCVDWHDNAWVVVRWALIETPMWTVVIECRSWAANMVRACCSL